MARKAGRPKEDGTPKYVRFRADQWAFLEARAAEWSRKFPVRVPVVAILRDLVDAEMRRLGMEVANSARATSRKEDA